MSAIANQRSIRNITRSAHRPEKLNILTFATHERYEENLCKTGHNFYSLAIGKTWDTDYAMVPDNYHIINTIPDYVDFDLILTHTSCERMLKAHEHLTGVNMANGNRSGIPILRHTHVLPDVRFDVANQIADFQNYPSDKDSFISTYNMGVWGGFSDRSAGVIEHGIDTEFWSQGAGNTSRELYCLSVVNEFPSRDWCCGFNLWKEVAYGTGISCEVVGKCTGENAGFSQPAQCREHLRQIYQTAAVFLNTSIHSPVPTAMMEAMACGCPVVTTGTCMIPEIIEHGVNGIIANDASDMKFWCRELLDKPDLARKLGEAGRKTIEEKYTLKRFVDNWNNMFASVVNEYK